MTNSQISPLYLESHILNIMMICI